MKMPAPIKWIVVAIGIVLVTIILAAWMAVIGYPVRRQYNLTLQGRVIDEKGLPVPGALVWAGIERRCVMVGTKAIGPILANFNTKTNAQGEFELKVRGVFHVNTALLKECTTYETRFACKDGYYPAVIHSPEEGPLVRGIFDLVFVLNPIPEGKVQGTGIGDAGHKAFMCRDEN